uniref:hypothetical protein n=1 Tax=Nonomuraea sp. CA-251285 TaxID=3240002 RepID=UPI003F495CF7
MISARQYWKTGDDRASSHTWLLRTARNTAIFTARRCERERRWYDATLTAHGLCTCTLPRERTTLAESCPHSQFSPGGACWHHQADDRIAASALAMRATQPGSAPFWHYLATWALNLKPLGAPYRDGMTAVVTGTANIHAAWTMDMFDRRSPVRARYMHNAKTLCEIPALAVHPGGPGQLLAVNCPACKASTEWKAALCVT